MFPSEAFFGAVSMVRSLRWRLQAWHAVVLMVVVSIFGGVVYQLQWQTRLQQIDAELDRTAVVLHSRVRRLFPVPNWFRRGPDQRGQNEQRGQSDQSRQGNQRSSGEQRGSNEQRNGGYRPASDQQLASVPSTGDRPQGNPPPDFSTPGSNFQQNNRSTTFRPWNPPPPMPEPRVIEIAPRAPRAGETLVGPFLPEEFHHLFDSDKGPNWYFVIWGRDGVVWQKSDSAPPIDFPDLKVEGDAVPPRVSRSNGLLREVIHVSGFGTHVLVGKSLQADLAEQRTSGFVLGMSGLGVLAVGLIGGWWLSGRAIKPIARMSASAAAISAENISQRIDLGETEDELSELAGVLNQTFDRLQAAFEQQKRFTADASHELRTPLAVILTQAEFATSRPRSVEEYRGAFEACERAGRRMKSLIDSLLMLARFDSGQLAVNLREMDLAMVAEDSVELLKPLADERGISIKTELSATRLQGDRERLSQVLVNLLSNAIRYNHDNGQVEVRVEAQNGCAILQVSDTGIGIPDGDLPHIFDRFYRVDQSRTRADGGSGLGLAICHSIVEAHHGTITARSELQSGTRIEVRLPRRTSNGKL